MYISFLPTVAGLLLKTTPSRFFSPYIHTHILKRKIFCKGYVVLFLCMASFSFICTSSHFFSFSFLPRRPHHPFFIIFFFLIPVTPMFLIVLNFSYSPFPFFVFTILSFPLNAFFVIILLLISSSSFLQLTPSSSSSSSSLPLSFLSLCRLVLLHLT